MIAVTIGDPNGIGPELVVRGFAERRFSDKAIVYGDLQVLEYAAERLALPGVPSDMVVDCGALSQREITPGIPTAAGGQASIEYVRRASLDAIAGKVDAVCTLPINKLAIRQSIEDFQGHTEYIANMCAVKDYSMMLASERLAVAHVSTHVSLLKAVSMVRSPRIVTVGRLLIDMLRRFLPEPRVAVTGLNPHAGESGSFGTEDGDFILPAVEELNRLGYPVQGPIPADTVFLRAFDGAFDGVVCMYHDQGHIPMKTMDFDGTVNVTLGLPIIRTSVDHGTAYDIVYKGVARLTNIESAFRYAVKLVDSR